jgi:hypothetical protein
VKNIVFASLFVLSLSTAAAAFAQISQAGAVPLVAACPSCDARGGCAGSTCVCQYQDGTGKYACVVNH